MVKFKYRKKISHKVFGMKFKLMLMFKLRAKGLKNTEKWLKKQVKLK